MKGPDGNLLTGVRQMVKDFMKAANDGLREVQDRPIGYDKRSQRELSIMMKKLQDLPNDVRQVKMTEMANVAGHKGDGFDNCSLCTFIKDKLG
jgi:hypothetical protein